MGFSFKTKLLSLKYLLYCVLMCVYSYAVPIIMNSTSQMCDGNDDSNNNSSVVFIVLFVIAVVIIILLTIVSIYLVVRLRKTSYSPNDM